MAIDWRLILETYTLKMNNEYADKLAEHLLCKLIVSKEMSDTNRFHVE